MSITAGNNLRHLREALKLTLRDVESGSSEIAARHGNQEFFIPFSRLSEIETKGTVPSLYRIYTLAAIYQSDFGTICSWYGVNLNSIVDDTNVVEIPKTHRFGTAPRPDTLSLPLEVDPGFDVRRTMNLGRMIQSWGIVPLQFLPRLQRTPHTYAFLGTEDLTMYPLLMPGSFLQVDESRTQILREGWRSEYERPIYFVEAREEFLCSWCNITESDQLVIQPHPLSPATPRVFRYRQDVDVIGQVVGVAMRLTDWKPIGSRSPDERQARLN